MRMLHCLNMLNIAKNIPGDVLELGVARGDTTFPMSSFLASINSDKKIYACDTFDGLPYDDSIDGPHKLKKGEINWGGTFERVLSMWYLNNIVIIKGLVEETLPANFKDSKFSFVWIDMDLYDPTSFSYKFLEDKINMGGIIGFHDYNFVRCPGIKKVVDSELNHNKYKKISNENTCIFFQRVK